MKALLIYVNVLLLIASCSCLSEEWLGTSPVMVSLVSPSPDRIFADVQSLVNFGSRHSCDSGDAGVERAADWLAGQYAQIPGIRVQFHEFKMNCNFSSRVRRNVIASYEGTDQSDELILFTGHYDSIAAHYLFFPSSVAPGANDSGSQSAVLLEVARQLAGAQRRRTIGFVAFAGEEQEMKGSEALVRDLKVIWPNKRVVAVINLDIVGGDRDVNSADTLNQYRLYSRNDKIHLELAQRIQQINQRHFPEFEMEWHKRTDRFGRGSDHMSFQDVDIPAIRIIEAVENTDHQHNTSDLPEYLTPSYMAKIARLVVHIAEEMAQ